MSLKSLVATGLGVAAVSAALDRTAFPVALSAVSAILLTLGFRIHAKAVMMFGAVFLYYPLTLALSEFLLVPLSFASSAVLLVVYTEKLGFENELSFANEGATGIDSESKTLVEQVRKAHTKRLLTFFLSVLAIIFASVLISAYTPAALEVVLVALGLLVIAAIYALKS
jgi:hypothetical protein